MLNIEVAYATAGQQFLVQLKLQSPATVAEAIQQSGVLERFPELDIESVCVGIFSQSADLDTGLEEGDRVEIYRPLVVDPKEARRLRAAAKKKKSG